MPKGKNNGCLRYRILSRISYDEDSGCWLWQGTTSGGYGQISIANKMKPAHRATFVIYRGIIPIGKELDHLCRTRRCVNPWHLEPVTHKVNTLRGVSLQAVNAKKTHCPAGHTYDGENTRVWRGSRVCIQCGKDRSKRWRLQCV